MKKNIQLPQSYLTPFPDPRDVFTDPVPQYFRHLHPLVTINLNEINPDWNGKIHMVSPIEPCDGCIGEAAENYYTDYMQFNWFGFRLDENSKYELLGSFKYFLEERPEGPEPYSGAQEEIVSFYIEENKKYNDARESFFKNGKLTFLNSYVNEGPPALEQLGGGVSTHDLSYGSGIKLDESDPENVVPLTPDNRRFTFIASTRSYFYNREGGTIYLFFEPKSRVCLFTFHYD